MRRGGRVESWHFAAAAVVTPGGRPVFRLGGPDTATYLRSCAKPFQAVPLVRALSEAAAAGREVPELEDPDLALVCASHSGGPQQVERVASLLAGGGFSTEDLRCGVHAPMGGDYAEALRRRGEEPGPLHNNCSGKHAGMLLACRLRGHDPAGYLQPEHPLQREILAEIERFCAVPRQGIVLGVDGCSVPTYHLPLRAAARGWAALAEPRLAELPEGVAGAAERLLGAMARAPEMLAGPGRFTTALARATGGRVVGKEGAEGLYCMAVRGPVALGVAFKIADGSDRARDGVAMEILRQIGSLSSEEFAELEEYYRPRVRNHRGLEVGEIVPELELEEV